MLAVDEAWFGLVAVMLGVIAPQRAMAISADEPPAVWSCDFRGPVEQCGFSLQARSRMRARPVVARGIPGIKLITEPGDDRIAGSGRAERADLSLSSRETDCRNGSDQWWSHAILFPDQYAHPVATGQDSWPWGVVFDFHHTGNSGQANFQIEVAEQPSQLRFALSSGDEVSDGSPRSGTRRYPIGPLVKNHWYRFVYHVKWSDRGDGIFQAWADGVQKINYRGPTLYAGQQCYLKLANYHTPHGQSVTVIHGPIARAPSRQELPESSAP